MRTTLLSLRDYRPKFSYSERASGFWRRRALILTLGATYLAGMLCGRSFAGQLGELDSMVNTMVSGFLQNRAVQSVWQNFLTTFLGVEASLLVLYLCGFCTIALPVVYFVVFFRGLGPGLSLTLLFAQMGGQGFAPMLVMLPGTAGGAIVLIVAAREAIKLSAKLLQSSRGRGELPFNRVALEFSVKFLLLTAVALGVALLDGLLFYVFGNVIV